MKMKVALMILTLVGISLTGEAIQAQPTNPAETQQSNTLDLSTIDCRDLLQMEGEERESTLTFFHGVMNGKKNEMVLDGDALAAATDKIVNHCIDKPNDQLLRVFQEYR